MAQETVTIQELLDSPVTANTVTANTVTDTYLKICYLSSLDNCNYVIVNSRSHALHASREKKTRFMVIRNGITFSVPCVQINYTQRTIIKLYNLAGNTHFRFAGYRSAPGELQLVRAAEEEFVIWYQSAGRPVLPSVSREAYNFSDSEHILSQLPEEAQKEAEESLSIYGRPVELYNILLGRACRNPFFLKRCLHYKLQDKHKRRVQLSVSITRPLDDGQQTPPHFPLYIVLARPVSSQNKKKMQSSCYTFKRACKLTAPDGALTVGSPGASFILATIDKLSTELKPGSLAVLLVSFAGITNQPEIDLTEDHMFSPSNGGYCFMGNTPVDFIHFSKENSPKITLGESAWFLSTANLKSCYMQLSCSDGEKCLSFLFPHNSEAVKVPITITAEELGAKDLLPLDLHSSDKLPQVLRPRTGEVMFHYRYFDNMLHKAEVKEDYTCPFCYLECASFKGLECHLPASHDLFNYEFWGEGDIQVVVVSATINMQIVGEKLSPEEKAFGFCHRPMRRRTPKTQNQNANHARPLSFDLNMPGVSEHMDCEITAAGVSGTAADIIFSGPELASTSVPGSSNAPTTSRRFARSRKSSNKGGNARSQPLLERRLFFHSNTAQPLSSAEVYAEDDSEDEVYDAAADIEEIKSLDSLVDATKHQKRMMHLWNSFKRKQRVVADAHIPWACEAFSTHHKEELALSSQLLRCWNMFMVHLWELGLLHPKTMDKCLSIVTG